VGGRRWELQPAVQEDRAAGAGTARPCAAAGDRRGGGTAPQGGRLGPVGERRRELQPTGARARGGSTMRPCCRPAGDRGGRGETQDGNRYPKPANPTGFTR
jgi:hypothetical protein